MTRLGKIYRFGDDRSSIFADPPMYRVWFQLWELPGSASWAV